MRLRPILACSAVLVSARVVSACSDDGLDGDVERCTISAPATGALRAVGTRIVDQSDRVIALRGIAAGGRSKFAPYMPFDFDPAAPAGDARSFDGALGRYLDRTVSWGVDVLRVPFSWEALEPERGRIDEVYLGRYDRLLDEAWARGIWTIVDFHQDIYSEVFCGDGFPAWTVEDPPAPHHDCPMWFTFYLSDTRVKQAFDAFWSDQTGVRTAYRAMWDRMVMRHKDRPGVIGFEPINEPSSGSVDEARWAREVLAPFYSEMASRTRALDPDALVFFDATGYESLGEGTSLVRPEGEGLVFAPHFYDPDVFLTDGPPRVDVRARLGSWARYGTEWNVPVFVGEFGIPHDRPGAAAFVAAHYDTFDALAIHGSYWEYSETRERWNDERLNVLAEDGSEHDTVLGSIARPYARAVAGRDVQVSWDGAKGRLDVHFVAAGAGGVSEVVLPRRRYPEGESVRVTASGACLDRQGDRLFLRAADGSEVRLSVE